MGARGRRSWLGLDTVPGTTVTRYCASSLQTARMAMHAIRAGEGDVFIAAGVEAVSRGRRGHSDSPPVADDADPRDRSREPVDQSAVRGRAGALEGTGPRRVRRSGTDPRERGELPDVYIAMGQTAENVAATAGRGSCGAGRVRRHGHSSSTSRQRRPGSGSARSPRSPCRTGPSWKPTRARARGPRSSKLAELTAGLPARRVGHRGQRLPSQRRRRGTGHHVGRQGEAARHHAARSHRLDRSLGPLARDHGSGSGRGQPSKHWRTPA